MRRVLFGLLITASMFASLASGAGAEGQGQGPSFCSEIQIGRSIADVARNEGHSGTFNPGHGFVAFGVGCNPAV